MAIVPGFMLCFVLLLGGCSNVQGKTQKKHREVQNLPGTFKYYIFIQTVSLCFHAASPVPFPSSPHTANQQDTVPVSEG